MALIHQNLYQSDSLARIDMRRYLEQLTEAIGHTFRHEATGVLLTVRVPQPVLLNTHTAVPLGLVVNELVTNALKYAFAEAGAVRPCISVEVHRAPDSSRLELRVADNGIGLPELDVAQAHSLGLQLVAGLVQQMEATLHIERQGGTQFRIWFQEQVPDTSSPAL